MSDLWPAIFLSFRIAIPATCLTALVALPLAFWLGRRKRASASFLEAGILLPLVLPGLVMVLTVLFLKNFVPLRNYAQVFAVAIAASAVYAAAFFVVGLSKSERGGLLRLIWKQRPAAIPNAPSGPDV